MNKVSVMPQEETTQVAVRSQPSALDIVQAALASGNVEMYREAVALMKEMDSFAARKAFDAAMAGAKSKIPVIRKNRRVGFDHKSGDSRTEYSHETMAEIARTVDPILSEFGLSYRFRVSSEVSQPVLVTCIISHRDGHSESTTLTAGRDDSGKKNAIQQIGSTVTYLQRYTLKAALGLAAAADDDSNSVSEVVKELITQKQADTLCDLIEAHGKSRAAFLKWVNKAAKAEKMEDIPAELYQSCVDAIKAPVAK